MGSFANGLFTILTGWMRTAVQSLWNGLAGDQGNSLISWIGAHWVILALILCVTGAGVDLAVYLLRWRPLKVWSSFFHRIGKIRPDEIVSRESTPSESFQSTVPEKQTLVRSEAADEAGSLHDRGANAPIISAGSEMTRSGRIVPADSPYRPPEHDEFPQNREDTDYTRETAERNVILSRRRRRVRELLTEEEEDSYTYAPPQSVIDARDAYRQPVYPRKWNQKDEDDDV